MRYRFDSDLDAEPSARSSFGRPELPVQAVGEELRRYVARAIQGDGEAAAAFRRNYEPQVRRTVRRVLASRSPDHSRLGRRVREEVKRILQSHPNVRSDPRRVEDLVTAQICRAMLNRPTAPLRDPEAIRETVRY